MYVLCALVLGCSAHNVQCTENNGDQSNVGIMSISAVEK